MRSLCREHLMIAREAINKQRTAGTISWIIALTAVLPRQTTTMDSPAVEEFNMHKIEQLQAVPPLQESQHVRHALF